MSQQMYPYKEDFDYLNDPLPDDLLFIFGEQLIRARYILKDRTQKDVLYGLESLDWMLKEGNRLLDNAIFELVKKYDAGSMFTHRVTALKQYSQEIDISSQEHFPNATWAEYFAILSLAYIGEILEMENASCEHEPDRYKTGKYSFPIHWQSQCTESICIAECFREKEDLPTSTQVAGRKGGKVRASKFDNLISSVMSLYREKFANIPNLSNREAARRIYEILSEKELSVLRTDDPQLRIAKWIGKFK